MQLRGSVFIEPSPEDFLLLLGAPLKQQRGRGGEHVPVYFGSVRQRGFGFLSLLKTLTSSVIPFLGRTILPAVAPALGEFASGLLSDVGSGEVGLKEAIKHRGKQAAKQTWQNLQSSTQKGGGGRKRSPKSKKKRIAQNKAKKLVQNKKQGGKKGGKLGRRRRRKKTGGRKGRKAGGNRGNSLVHVRFRRGNDVFSPV
jgi:hypothetical protein